MRNSIKRTVGVLLTIAVTLTVSSCSSPKKETGSEEWLFPVDESATPSEGSPSGDIDYTNPNLQPWFTTKQKEVLTVLTKKVEGDIGSTVFTSLPEVSDTERGIEKPDNLSDSQSAIGQQICTMIDSGKTYKDIFTYEQSAFILWSSTEVDDIPTIFKHPYLMCPQWFDEYETYKTTLD